MLSQVTRAAWQASFSTPGLWQSQRNVVCRWLLEEFLAGRRNLTVTSLGGSASAWRSNYGFYLASHLRNLAGSPATASVRFFNPSHGYTGSDWGSSYLDSLVPQDTDVLLWEFAINDWPGHGPLSVVDSTWPGLKSTTWHIEAFEMFLRRLFLLNPRMVFGAVFLWKPSAASCWPHCADDDRVWRDDLKVLHHYANHIDAFAIDVNHLAKNTTTRRHLFRDKHHPSNEAHAAIGHALFERFRAVLPERSNVTDSAGRHEGPRARALPTPFSASLAPSNITERHCSRDLLAVLAHTFSPDKFRSPIRPHLASYSYYYGEPCFGPRVLQPVSPDALRPRRTGKAIFERVDNVQHVLIPPCSQNATLSYALDRVSRPRFVGINLRGRDGSVLLGGIEALDSALRVTVTTDNVTHTLSALSKASVDTKLTIVARGAFAPQAWYPVPCEDEPSALTAAGDPIGLQSKRPQLTDVLVNICRSAEHPFRNISHPSSHQNVAAVGGLVVLV